MAKGDFLNWLKGVADPATLITDTVVGSVEGIGNVVEKFVETPEKKAELQKAIMSYEVELRKEAAKLDQAQYADRASARQMAGVHGKLQARFAMAFLISFFVFLIADLGFIGWIAGTTIKGDALDFPVWVQTLITATLSSIVGYMVSMIKEIVGFLFGGSAGSDQTSVTMIESLRAKEATRK